MQDNSRVSCFLFPVSCSLLPVPYSLLLTSCPLLRSRGPEHLPKSESQGKIRANFARMTR